MINKHEIILIDVIEFCFNDLKTLVECNEKKINKIATLIEMYEIIKNTINIFSDENRLKQLLLNFISNAVKFTKTGFIKIKVIYLAEFNCIEISIEDSGLGIKFEDYHLNSKKTFN